MKHLKLFEAFNETDKVYEANSLFIDWLIFNYLVEKKAKAWNGVFKVRLYYQFIYPGAPTHIIKSDIFKDATGYLRERTKLLTFSAPNLWNRKPIPE